MRQVYACRLDMVYESEARTRQDAFRARVIARRLFEQYAGSDDWSDDDQTDWAPAPDHRVRIRRLDDDRSADAATVVLWERPHADPALRVSTEAIIGVEADRGWVVVRESIGSLDPTLTPPVENPRQAPGIVTELIKAIAFEDAMQRLSISATPVAAPDVLAIDAFLTTQRHLPVVVVSDVGDGRTTAVANRLAYRVAGLAHVFVLAGRAATEAFNREVGAVHGVPLGGARLYWPRFRTLDAARNRAWQATDVVGPDGQVRGAFIVAVVDAIFTAGALRVPDPPLLANLEAARVRRTIERRRAERAAREEEAAPVVREPVVAAPVVEAPVVEAVPEPAVSPVRDEVEEALLDETLGELQRVRDHLARVEADRDRWQRDFDTMRDRWIARAHTGEVHDEPPTAEPLVAVVERARSLPHLVVLPDALASARKWQYDRTGDVWNAFLALELLASDWAAGALHRSFTAEARERGLDWAGGVSDTAVQKFARDYVREVDGRQIVLGPHLRMSGGNRLLRIYCALDETPGPVGGPPVRRLIVGHVGEHLRDQGADD